MQRFTTLLFSIVISFLLPAFGCVVVGQEDEGESKGASLEDEVLIGSTGVTSDRLLDCEVTENAEGYEVGLGTDASTLVTTPRKATVDVFAMYLDDGRATRLRFSVDVKGYCERANAPWAISLLGTVGDNHNVGQRGAPRHESPADMSFFFPSEDPLRNAGFAHYFRPSALIRTDNELCNTPTSKGAIIAALKRAGVPALESSTCSSVARPRLLPE